MPEMRSLAPVRVASTAGYIVIVTPEGVHVPQELVPEAQARGCVIANDNSIAEPQEPEEIPVYEFRPKSREDKIREIIDEMVEENDEKNFTKEGIPRVAAVSKRFGEPVASIELLDILEKRK